MITPLPIHFKEPGRSYSQIGRKGNVALYQVFSDYLIIPSYALPYVLVGFELVCIKIDKTGRERYPRPEEFGKSAWSIPKSFSSTRRIGSRSCEYGSSEFRSQTPPTLLDRSAAPEEPAHLAAGAPEED